MLSNLREWLIDRKNPCKKCLVRATYRPFKTNCDEWKQFIKKRDKAEAIKDFLILASLIVGFLFIIITFIFGILKWIRLIF